MDPLFRGYPWNSPYAFAENKVIQFIELEGAEIALPNIFPRIFVPRPTITIPRIPVPPTPPMVPVMPIPPQAIPQSPSAPVPQVPLSVPKMEINDIGWENPPNSPEDLGSDWEETTVPENTSGSRDFKNKKTSEEIRWDPARPGKGGHQEKNHWHRKNPNWDKSMKKNGKYLDKHGNPVDDGSGPSHIYTIRPVIIRPTSEQQVNHYNKKSKQYNVDLKRYNKAIKKYNRELKRYYKELEKNVEYT